MAIEAVRPSDQELISRLESSMCIKCTARPKGIGSAKSGRLCQECSSELSNVRYAWKTSKRYIEWICALCHINHVTRTDAGNVSQYCDACARLSSDQTISSNRERMKVVVLPDAHEIARGKKVNQDDRRFAVITDMTKLIDMVSQCIERGDDVQISVLLTWNGARIVMESNR